MAISFKADLETVDKNSGELLIVCEKLGITTHAAREHLRIAMANAILMNRKQLDYGPRNISSFGVFGIIVRMNDKMERLKTLIGKGRKRRAHNESIADTLRDISNYATIALILDEGRWPSE